MAASFAITLAEMRARREEGISEKLLARLPTDCPPGLDQVLLRCLAPLPGDRFANAGELARQMLLIQRQHVDHEAPAVVEGRQAG